MFAGNQREQKEQTKSTTADGQWDKADSTVCEKKIKQEKQNQMKCQNYYLANGFLARTSAKSFLFGARNRNKANGAASEFNANLLGNYKN